MIRSLMSTAVAAILFSGIAQAAPTVTTERGYTIVTTSAVFNNALSTLKVTPGSLRPGVAGGSPLVLYFPISNGVIDAANAKGFIHHEGGIRLTAGSVEVQLRHFAIDTSAAQPVLTGTVIANNNVVARAPLFNLTLPTLSGPITPSARGEAAIAGVKLSLTDAAASTLNGAFGVTAFTGGLDIGTATVDLAAGSISN